MSVKTKISSKKLDSLINDGKWDEAIKAQLRQVRQIYDNGHTDMWVLEESLVRRMFESVDRRIKELEKPTIANVGKSYDKKMGDDKICICGHSYFKHFDSFRDMEHIGCKYCPCKNFEAREEL